MKLFLKQSWRLPAHYPKTFGTRVSSISSSASCRKYKHKTSILLKCLVLVYVVLRSIGVPHQHLLFLDLRYKLFVPQISFFLHLLNDWITDKYNFIRFVLFWSLCFLWWPPFHFHSWRYPHFALYSWRKLFSMLISRRQAPPNSSCLRSGPFFPDKFMLCWLHVLPSLHRCVLYFL